MQRKTTNTEVRSEHAKRLLPRGDANLSAHVSGLLPLSGAGAGNASSSPLPVNPNDLLAATLKDTAQQLNQWRAATQAQADAVAQNTSALQQNTASRSKGSTAGSILSTASSFLGGGLGALPLISGLVGLFSGGPKSSPVLPRYLAPPSLSIQNSVDAGGSAGPAVYDQYGMPRAASSQAAAPQPSVTVNVQAMDSRSFMDHSAAIAGAVREAMLNLHSINDVVNEL
ncbi:MAG TPA: hypothetical protein DEQ47_04290 [Solibacterales bacterium]|nr:hypothetical protein [Bryobacterales bacterium]